jgi:hypothetical protein
MKQRTSWTPTYKISAPRQLHPVDAHTGPLPRTLRSEGTLGESVNYPQEERA